jgi:hypothetical protein
MDNLFALWLNGDIAPVNDSMSDNRWRARFIGVSAKPNLSQTSDGSTIAPPATLWYEAQTYYAQPSKTQRMRRVRERERARSQVRVRCSATCPNREYVSASQISFPFVSALPSKFFIIAGVRLTEHNRRLQIQSFRKWYQFRQSFTWLQSVESQLILDRDETCSFVGSRWIS